MEALFALFSKSKPISCGFSICSAQQRFHCDYRFYQTVPARHTGRLDISLSAQWGPSAHHECELTPGGTQTRYSIKGIILTMLNFFCLIYFLNIYFWERECVCEQGRGRERGRHKIQSSRLWAVSGAPTHDPRHHDLGQSWTLNWLSHPDAQHYCASNAIRCCLESGFCSQPWFQMPSINVLFLKILFQQRQPVRLRDR